MKGDNVQEDDETIEIALQQPPKNATLAAGKSKATGTITDDDVLQTVAKDWMARFGRTAAAATVDAIAIRMNDAASSAGEDHSLTLAGRRLAFAGAAPLRCRPRRGSSRGKRARPVGSRCRTWPRTAPSISAQLGGGVPERVGREFLPPVREDVGIHAGRQPGLRDPGGRPRRRPPRGRHGTRLPRRRGEYGDIGRRRRQGELAAALYSFHPYVRLTIGDYLHIGGSFGAWHRSMNIKPAGGKEVETSDDDDGTWCA